MPNAEVTSALPLRPVLAEYFKDPSFRSSPKEDVQSISLTKQHKCTQTGRLESFLTPSKSPRSSKKMCCQIPDGFKVDRKVHGCAIGGVKGGFPSRSVRAHWLVVGAVAGKEKIARRLQIRS